MISPHVIGALSALALLAPSSAQAAPLPSAPEPSAPGTAAERAVDRYLSGPHRQPGWSRDFFADLPKGGDLHNHLSGAVSTEFLIELAAEDGLCVVTATSTAVPPPCGAGTRPAADAVTDAEFRRQVIRAWSMQDFPADGNGHDHFFATFGKFGEVTWRHPGRMLAEVANTAARQKQFYLETMISPAFIEARALADRVGFDADLDRMHDKLLADGALDAVVRQARADADATDVEFRTAAHCDTPRPDPACALPYRWIAQVGRAASPERVFTQLALGMRLAERDSRFVAVNLVQPEDDPVALRDYRLHMRMLNHLKTHYPKAHITLHAGELVPGLVKPEDLTFHIREAAQTGRAERIGHGVSVLHEDRWESLMRHMAERRIAVEVPFHSNQQILRVSGDAHPFATYRRFGVPVVLATDDPGVSRIEITDEYRRASEMYGLRYRELKDLARASLDHAFLPGRSLWQPDVRTDYRPVAACAAETSGSEHVGARCGRLLESSPKAQVQWRQEAAFARFEADRARPGGPGTH
ncbi:adenosine deaminase [Streptomyces sp. DK15]|uniref:adenosine deaminase family protein n=1 Tax=Streptomyces sp. DK15 TaxID=2957499 RepID=UPI0029BE3DE0|nr:adenosine deaminase [Streptomyces sp. DK15]MDX2394886.1 adenosine deaminase [Streptomyces sp. DK15]